MSVSRPLVAGLAGAIFLLASCGGTDSGADATDPAPTTESALAGDAIARVSVDQAAALVEDPPTGLVVLDVRTPEEFTQGHLDGAELIDFYDPNFADRIAELDRTTPYLVYCRSDNRSGEALAVMDELGFTSVVDIEGGIVAWIAADLPITTS